MKTTKTETIAVIGGGIIGLTIALTLQQRNQKVVLIEKNTISSGASGGNAGHLATEQVFPVADPSILKRLPKMLIDPLGPLHLKWRYLLPITPWLFKVLKNMGVNNFNRIHEALLSLSQASLPAWRDFAETWDLQEYLKINGSLLVAETDKNITALKKLSKTLNPLGVENQWVTSEELHDLEPQLSEAQRGGLFYPQTGHITNLTEIANVLSRQFIALGGEVKENTKVTAIQEREDEITIQTEKGLITSRYLVLATGAFSKPFAEKLSQINVPLETERGYHLMLPEEKNRLSIPVTSADWHFIMTPMEEGLRLAGTVEYGGLKLPPNMKRARNFLPLAQKMLKTSPNQNNATEWMGFRPTLSDSLPIIDRQKRILYAFGHQHLGLTHAPITAKLIEALFFEKPPPLNCKPFSIRRFN